MGSVLDQLVLADELTLVSIALTLGAERIGGPLSTRERELAKLANERPRPQSELAMDVRSSILAGDDVLGEALSLVRPSADKRRLGAFYTERPVVAAMVQWILSREPGRIVDPGCGSGRFLLEVLQRDPELAVVGIDIDPVATLCTRAVMSTFDANCIILNADFVTVSLPGFDGTTAFIGNPPYVRHHALSQDAKKSAVDIAETLGIRLSSLSGLHAHFFVATAKKATAGDLGCFITSAEWLDVNYGSAIRQLLMDGLGLRSLHLFDVKSTPFSDAMSTAVITSFRVGPSRDSIGLQTIRGNGDIEELAEPEIASRADLVKRRRWSGLFKNGETEDGAQCVRLGEIARVHRGVATGANNFFVLGKGRAKELGVEQWCRPVISSAREIIQSEGRLLDGPERKVILDVPPSIDRQANPALDRYLKSGETNQGGREAVSLRYLARHRRPWWNLGIPKVAPIISTYMARQPPVFAVNEGNLALTNIAHGIFPKQEISKEAIEELVLALNGARNQFKGRGRTYQGGLEKFEPRELEDLPIPDNFAPV